MHQPAALCFDRKGCVSPRGAFCLLGGARAACRHGMVFTPRVVCGQREKMEALRAMEAEVRRWQQDAHDAKRETRLLKKKAKEQVTAGGTARQEVRRSEERLSKLAWIVNQSLRRR